MTPAQRFGLAKKASGTRFVILGAPEETSFVSKDENGMEDPYYRFVLAEEANVKCSTDPKTLPFMTSEVYVRESALHSEDWQMVDENDEEAGMFAPNWVIDYSTTKDIPVLQDTTILQWSRDQRSVRGDKAREKRNDSILKMTQDRAARLEAIAAKNKPKTK